MLTKLRLTNFKNFKQAELDLGPFTVLVGANASGKSNIRDAFRFLHGIGRGYNLAEIIGEKYGEGGILQWRGIRGGTRELAYDQYNTLSVWFDALIRTASNVQKDIAYEVSVNVRDRNIPIVTLEKLAANNRLVFEALSEGFEIFQEAVTDIPVWWYPTAYPDQVFKG